MWLTVPQLAELLNITPQAVRKAIAERRYSTARYRESTERGGAGGKGLAGLGFGPGCAGRGAGGPGVEGRSVGKSADGTGGGESGQQRDRKSVV